MNNVKLISSRLLGGGEYRNNSYNFHQHPRGDQFRV